MEIGIAQPELAAEVPKALAVALEVTVEINTSVLPPLKNLS